MSMPSNNKRSPDEKESGGGTSSQSIQDEIKLLSSELKKVRKEHESFRDDIKASLLDVIDLINLANVDESKAQCDEIIKALPPRDESPVREASKENERKELSEVVLSSDDDDGVVETMSDGAPSDKVEVMNDDDSSGGVVSSSTLMDDEAPPAVRTSNQQSGKSKHPTKKKKKSKNKKKKKANKSKKNRPSNNSSNKAVNNSSTNSYYWGTNGGVSLKAVKRVVMGLMSVACLLSMTFGQGNMEEQHSKSSPGRKQQRQHKTRQRLITNAQGGEDGEKSITPARILQTSGLPTYSPITPLPTETPTTDSPTMDLIYEGCEDTKDWVDKFGDDCRWYENNDEPGCPVHGNDDGDMGPAKDHCCHCQRTVSPSTSSHPTSSSNPTYSPTTSYPSHSNSPTTTLDQKCPVADKATCGCDVVFKSDYRGTIKVTAGGAACIRWDESDVAKYPNAGLEDNNFCRNPDIDPDGPWCWTGAGVKDFRRCDIPACDDQCLCMPPCGQQNDATCGCPSALQSQECCKENDSSCKCNYLKDACRISLQSNSTEFCEEAEAECCNSMGGSSNSECECLMYEDICIDIPGETTCEKASNKCCAGYEVCLCDFFEYTSNDLNYDSDQKEEACRIASSYQFPSSSAYEREDLEWLYNNLGGEYWTTKTNWLNDTVPHCDWFGVTCNDDGYVTEINLNSNNLSGIVDSNLWGSLYLFSELAKLDLSNNSLPGRLDEWSDHETFTPYDVRKLGHLDLSGNSLSGHAPMWFSVTTSYVNLSHTNITSISFRRSIPSYESLEVLDVSNNNIAQGASHVLRNIPPNLVKLDLSHNLIKGALPEPFPSHNTLQEFSVANNRINGIVPDFSRATPLIRVLDLSNQQLEMNGGLAGTIPPALSKLDDLIELYLAGNKLSGSIPTQFGNFLQLKVLNLASNVLKSMIPTELGRLDGSLDVLDLSQNILTGVIPSVFGRFPSHFMVHLNGNSNLSSRSSAPLSLCSTGRTDLENGTSLCPIERNALRAIYQSAKGSEWTNSDGWLDEYTSYCKWRGVTCYCEKEVGSCNETDSDVNVYQLSLKSNGLSGTLSQSIGNLSSLAVLDLRDNDIKGSVPEAIGSLSNLTHLQLSYNTFRGALPSSFSNLSRLQMIHLHANRFSGVVPLLDSSLFDDKLSFIADCGYPSLYEKTLNCTNCTMCCNSQDECTPKDNTLKSVNPSYVELAGIFLACIFGFQLPWLWQLSHLTKSL